jgi:branched-subunit amino acid aminotransferase/4-amino-4-deoxychorismate lyase
LSLPLDDRGLTLADGLFETVLVEQGQARLLDAHLERWHRSAALLGMEVPPNRQGLEPLLAAALVVHHGPCGEVVRPCAPRRLSCPCPILC